MYSIQSGIDIMVQKSMI